MWDGGRTTLEGASYYDLIVKRDNLSSETYTKLLALRTALRRFERASEQRARDAGMTVARHQLLLAIRGHDDERGPTIGDVANYLLVRHHSVVGLVDRAENAGLVTRRRDPDDHRMVRLAITDEAEDRLASISVQNVAELQQLSRLMPDVRSGFTSEGTVEPPLATNGKRRAGSITVASVHDAPITPGTRVVLVDRLWPRGLAKSETSIDLWVRDIAPSTALRQWYGHNPDRFEEFRRRYEEELQSGPAATALGELRTLARDQNVTIVTATRDLEGSCAAVLRDLLSS